MLKTDRYRGLQLLKEFGIPIPAIQVVENREQVETLYLSNAAHGWTIRTCRRDGMNEQDLFYRNRLPQEKVKPLLIERLSEGGKDEFFIIYQSWSFQFSCNAILTEKTYYFEGNYGSQKSIANGIKQPDFAFSVGSGPMRELHSQVGEVTNDVLEQTQEAVSYLRRLPFRNFYTELAYTREHSLVFFELWILGPTNRTR